MNATYNLPTNKIKFYPPPGRLTPEQDKERRACKFVWYPGQKCFAAAWSPSAVDFVESFGIEIEADDSPDDVAARAERFGKYAESAERSSDSAAEYASTAATEKRAERALSRAASEAERAAYWTRRIAAAISHAEYKDRPDVIARRIKGLESDLRKQTANHKKATLWLSRWQNLTPGDYETAVKLANYGSFYVDAPASAPYKQYSAWSALTSNQMTAAEVREAALIHFARSTEYARRWIEHLQTRIEYERAFMESVGGDPVAKLDGLKPGDQVIYRKETCTVLKVNKTTIEIKIPSYHWLKDRGVKVDKTDLKPAPTRDETARALAAEFSGTYPELKQYGTVEEVDPDSGYAATHDGKPANAWTVKISGAWYDVYTNPIGEKYVLGVVPA